MKKFDTFNGAFQHFLDNDYKGLPPKTKIKYKDARYDFLKRKSISYNKMGSILTDYATIKIEVIFDKNTKFDSFEKAFTHFLKKEYKKLPPETKAKYKDARYDFLKRNSISHNKIVSILKQHSTINLEITFEE